MKIGIMQPYFLPYLGYFSLIHATDQWVVFDEVQFIRHGWIERNRVLNSNREPSYIKVNLRKHSRETLIKDVFIHEQIDWKKKIFDQLTSYKKKAPFYNSTIEFLEDSLKLDFIHISQLNIHLLKAVCNYIDLPFNYSIYSEMGFDLKSQITHPGQWALEITKKMGGTAYINPKGGIDLFEVEEFGRNKIQLFACENNLIRYPQFSDLFVQGLSIIDVLMFNSKRDTLELIKNYNLHEK